MNEKKNPGSLFLYTALIFLVALIMIIISFFGQGERESMKQQAQTLTEKATAVSEQNLVLTEKVSSLENELTEKNNLITILTKESETYKNLIKADALVTAKKLEEAYEIIKNIDSSILTDETLGLYDKLYKKTKHLSTEGKEE